MRKPNIFCALSLIVLETGLASCALSSAEIADKLTTPKHNTEVFNLHVKIDGKSFHEAIGYIKNVGDSKVVVQKGQYEVNFPKGSQLRVQYDADEDGYRAKSEHRLLPAAPIPQTFTPPPQEVSAQLFDLPAKLPTEPTLLVLTLPTEASISLSPPSTTESSPTEPTIVPTLDTREPVIGIKAIGSLVG